jgi:hypothetical protein
MPRREEDYPREARGARGRTRHRHRRPEGDPGWITDAPCWGRTPRPFHYTHFMFRTDLYSSTYFRARLLVISWCSHMFGLYCSILVATMDFSISAFEQLSCKDIYTHVTSCRLSHTLWLPLHDCTLFQVHSFSYHNFSPSTSLDD